jgi:hypothetical protein
LQPGEDCDDILGAWRKSSQRRPVPHIHISKDLGGGWEPVPQLSGAATIFLYSAALREDLGNGSFAPEAWDDTAVAPPDFDSRPSSGIRGLFPNGRGLPLLQQNRFSSWPLIGHHFNPGNPPSGKSANTRRFRG